MTAKIQAIFPVYLFIETAPFKIWFYFFTITVWSELQKSGFTRRGFHCKNLVHLLKTHTQNYVNSRSKSNPLCLIPYQPHMAESATQNPADIIATNIRGIFDKIDNGRFALMDETGRQLPV